MSIRCMIFHIFYDPKACCDRARIKIYVQMNDEQSMVVRLKKETDVPHDWEDQ